MIITPEFSMPNFDTHKFVKSFVTAKTEEEKAEAIVRVIAESKSETQIEFEETKKDFDSKIDSLVTKDELKSEIKFLATKDELISEIKFAKEELRGEIKSLEIRLTNKIYLTTGSLAVFLSGLILGVLPIILK